MTITKKSKHKFNIKPILIFVIIAIAILSFSVYFGIYKKKSSATVGGSTDISPKNNPGITICTKGAFQPNCYESERPKFKLTWGCDHYEVSRGYIVQVQIDDQVDFSSVDEDSGKTTVFSENYEVVGNNLEFDQKYFWRMRAIPPLDEEWSNWAVHEESFTVSPQCINSSVLK